MTPQQITAIAAVVIAALVGLIAYEMYEPPCDEICAAEAALERLKAENHRLT